MPREPDENGSENNQIVLSLLESVERNSGQSHRRLAGELGIALGLINAYVRRCVNMGLLKVQKTPAHRYAYFLTPKGFTEKSRLMANYLSRSFNLFRVALSQCGALFRAAAESGMPRMVLVGASDVAAIAALCAAENGVTLVALVDRSGALASWGGLPAYATLEQVPEAFDAVMITAFDGPQQLRRPGRSAGREAGVHARTARRQPVAQAGGVVTSRWYVVYTQAHCEAQAAFHLLRQGFETYLPRQRKLCRHARKTQEKLTPLFPAICSSRLTPARSAGGRSIRRWA